MPKVKKPNGTDMVVYLMQRKDNALSQMAIHKNKGNVGQEVYWQTIAVDAGLLLGWVCADEWWTTLARQDADGLKQAVERLDALHKKEAA